MRNVVFLLSCMLSVNVWAACDADAVKSKRSSMQGFGTWNDSKPVIDFRWRAQTGDMPPEARVALMKQFAEWGRCVYGRPRAVDFYFGNRLIARTSTDGKYRAASEDFDDGTQIKFWFKSNSK